MNFASVERWSKWTFRRSTRPSQTGLELEPACERYDSQCIPRQLQVPRQIPRESLIGLTYRVPYYHFTGRLFKALYAWPLSRGVPWSASTSTNDAFPVNEEGWRDVNEDRAFARLRLQGPNPFLLRATSEGDYEVDYEPFFSGICEDVHCVFRLQEAELVPLCIHVGAQQVEPGDTGWERAKLLANGLDARYCVFTRHLLDSHLLVGQAFAIAAFEFPPQHPLRSFFHMFTYGTLVVSEFAYRLLITPASYFMQARFVTRDDVMGLWENSLARFSLKDLVVPRDIEARGIGAIPGHPYVEDAIDVWEVFRRALEEWVDALYSDDARVAADEALQRLRRRLTELLPNEETEVISTRGELVELLGCLLYNNVNHEICGDFSVFGQSRKAEHKRLVNFAALKAGDEASAPEHADVFLFDQAAFAGRFNNGGNNLLRLPSKAAGGDEKLAAWLAKFQGDLRHLDARLEARNRDREIPLLRMLPRKWEASISF